MEGGNPRFGSRGVFSLPNIAVLRPASEFSSKTRLCFQHGLGLPPQDPACAVRLRSLPSFPQQHREFLLVSKQKPSKLAKSFTKTIKTCSHYLSARVGECAEHCGNLSAQFGKMPSEPSDTFAQFGMKPSEASDASAHIGKMPSEASDGFAQVGMMPSEPSDTSAQFGKMPSEPSDASAQFGKMPSEVSDASAQFRNTLSEVSDTFAQFRKMPSETSDTSTQHCEGKIHRIKTSVAHVAEQNSKGVMKKARTARADFFHDKFPLETCIFNAHSA